MSDVDVKVEGRTYALSMAGPGLVILSVLLLVVKHSPFYIDFSVAALVGMVIAWRWKLKGFVAASTILYAVLLYDHFFEAEVLSVWDLGLGASLQVAFLVTALASLDLVESFNRFGKQALEEVQSWEAKYNEVFSGKDELEESIAQLKVSLDRTAQEVKTHAESAALFERLLGMARGELIEQTTHREKYETGFYIEKNRAEKLEEKMEDFTLKLHKKEAELKEKDAVISETQGKLNDLGEQLEKLTDRLAGLQSEKEEIEKALEEALQGGEKSRDLKKVEGLYQQLRGQFMEKSQLLDQTRKELFHAQEQLLALPVSHQEQWLTEHAALMESFQKQFNQAEARNKELEQEIIQLENIITSQYNTQD